MATIGLLILFIGAACADSQNLVIPTCLIFLGGALGLIGAINESTDL